MGEETDEKVLAERDTRKEKLWPRMKNARKEGKVAFFNRQEQDKLYVDAALSVKKT